MLRYRVEETDDGLAGEEGTFAICSFWLVSALAEIGEHDRGPRAVRAHARVRLPPDSLRRGDRRRARAGTSATSRRPSRTSRSSTPSCTSSKPTTRSWRRSAAARGGPGAGGRRLERLRPQPLRGRRRGRGARGGRARGGDRRRRARFAAPPTSRSPGAPTSRPRSELLGGKLPDWSDVHLWYGDERVVPLDDEQANHRLCTENLDAPGATWHPVPTAARAGGRWPRPPRARARRQGARRRAERPRARRAHGLALPRPSRAARGGRVRRGSRLAEAPGRARHAHPRQAQRVPAPAAAGHRHEQGRRPRARPRGPEPRVPGLAARPLTPGDHRRRGGPALADHPTQEVWLVRHAETEWSRDGKHTGITDVALTDKGREVARALGERMAPRDFALVLRARSAARARPRSSPASARAPRSATTCSSGSYGDYEGITTAEIREARPDWYLWTDGAPDGETPEQVASAATA